MRLEGAAYEDDRPRRRRHHVDRARDPRGRRGGAARRRPAARRRAARRGRRDDRGQVGLRPRPRDRAPDAARRARDRPRAPGAGSHDASSAPTPSPRARPPTPTSTRSASRRCAPRAAEGLVDAVDGFCEGIAFSPGAGGAGLRRGARARPAGQAPRRAALQPRRRARWRPRSARLSADHLEYLDEDGVAAMAAAGTVAVILPGAFYTLRETRRRRSPRLRAAGVPMAVATDCNPGTSPMTSLLLAMNMACTLFRLTPEEALAGATRVAARALGLDDCGTIAPGPARRPRGLGRRPPGRARLPHRLQPARTRGCSEASNADAPAPSPSPRSKPSGAAAPAALDPGARPGIEAAAARVAAAVAAGAPVYGVNTGFGKLASVAIPAADTARLQRNLILSHCSGVGDADAGADRPPDDGAEARLARPRRLGRALGARRAPRGDARARRHPGGAGPGLGRRLAATSRRSPTWPR